LNDSSVKLRTQGLGVLSREEAFELGAVGPMARASGIDIDMRKSGYAAYGKLKIEPVVETAGDWLCQNIGKNQRSFFNPLT